jgi:choloylglycine hydrolase
MEYWKEAGGLEKSLPGTSRAADRFVRTSFLRGALPAQSAVKYISGTPQQNFKFQAPMAVLSLMRSVGTPLGFSLEDQPWVSSTIWRTVSDSTDRVVVYDSAMAPATFWVKLDELDLKQGAPVKKLQLAGGRSYSGNAKDQFADAKAFTFQDLTDVAPAR